MLRPLLLIAAAGAALAPMAADAAQGRPARACFYARDTDGFSAPDDRTVYLRSGVRDVYELKLFSPCSDVDWNMSIAVKTHGSSWICEGNGLDVDIISHSPIGPQRCAVTSVRKLTPQEIAALPRGSRP